MTYVTTQSEEKNTVKYSRDISYLPVVLVYFTRKFSPSNILVRLVYDVVLTKGEGSGYLGRSLNLYIRTRVVSTRIYRGILIPAPLPHTRTAHNPHLSLGTIAILKPEASLRRVANSGFQRRRIRCAGLIVRAASY